VRMILEVAIDTILMTGLVAAQPAPLKLGQAVEQSEEKYPAVRSSLEQVSAAAAGINLIGETAPLPLAHHPSLRAADKLSQRLRPASDTCTPYLSRSRNFARSAGSPNVVRIGGA
jgi:hypothetical protein